MTVQELLDLLQKFPNKQATVYMQSTSYSDIYTGIISEYSEPVWIVESLDKLRCDIQCVSLPHNSKAISNIYYPGKDTV